MQVLEQIFLDFCMWFSVVAGIFGVILFGSMLFSLQVLRTLGKILNRSYSTTSMEDSLNHRYDSFGFKTCLKYNRISGLALIGLVSWIFYFLVFQFHPDELIMVLELKPALQPLCSISLQSLQWIGIVGTVACFLVGLLFMLQPEMIERLQQAADSWVAFDEMVEKKLDQTISKDIDTICFLKNGAIGAVGLVCSLLLLIKSLINVMAYWF